MATQNKEARRRKGSRQAVVGHDALVHKIRKRHVGSVPVTARRGGSTLNWLRVTASDVYYYIAIWLPKVSFVTITSLPSLLFDVVGLWSAVGFLVGSSVILFGTLILSAVWRLPWVQRVWRPYSKSKGVGLGNIAYPRIFDFAANPMNKRIRDAAFMAMSDPLSTFAQPSTALERNFDLEISKILMMLSALVYERDPCEVDEAVKCRARKKQANLAVFTEDNELTEAGEEIQVLYDHAEQKIVDVAREWGLNYCTISELATNTSPLCGAFWSPEHNFIIIAFKGTNPVEFKEWAIDFTFNYTDGRAWLPNFTKVHSGFYNQIFPQELDKSTEVFPYTEIRTTVTEIAEQIRKSSGNQHVNMYVTGHSLGAALGCLFYSRALISPKDFGLTPIGYNQVQVRDAYCFGTPVIGDPDCISALNQIVHDYNLDQPQTLWRITNKRDAVATLIPEAGDHNTLRHISPTSQLHFAHIGQEVQLTDDSNDSIKVYNGPGTLLPALSPVAIVSHLRDGGVGPSVSLPIYLRICEKVPLIGRLAVHAPSSYWASLTKVHSQPHVKYRSFH